MPGKERSKKVKIIKANEFLFTLTDLRDLLSANQNKVSNKDLAALLMIGLISFTKYFVSLKLFLLIIFALLITQYYGKWNSRIYLILGIIYLFLLLVFITQFNNGNMTWSEKYVDQTSILAFIFLVIGTIQQVAKGFKKSSHET